MPALNIDHVLSKIDELRSLFELGQRTMPFLEELFHFLEEIEPLLDEINASLRESTSKMPDARSKLKSVSEATELATTEILDLVDGVAFELKMMQKALNRKTEGLEAIREADERLLQLLRHEIGDSHPNLLEEITRIYHRRQPLLEEAINHADDERQAVDDVRDRMTKITMALQVQDITSQQIAAVNHIIESLRDRMEPLIHHPTIEANASGAPPEAAPADPGDGTFDGDARYAPGGNHQDLADELINSIRRPPANTAAAPAADASAETVEPSPEPAAADNPADTEAASATAASSNETDAPTDDSLDDLDDGQETIAQEDIDELFG